MKVIKYLILILLVGSTFGCESLEDTYSEFTEDGSVRYVGKITDVKIEAGWERFKLSWKNSLDPTVSKIKIVWTQMDETGEFIIEDPEQTEFETPRIFGNYVYSFDLIAVDDKGNESFKEAVYKRPYNKNHELLMGLGIIIDKYYYIKNNLVIIFGSYNSNIQNSIIKYYQGGELVSLEVTPEMVEEKFLILKDIDMDHVVAYARNVTIEDCYEEIQLEDYQLNRTNKPFYFDFAKELKERYQINEVNNDFINTVEEIELDYSIKSLVDILHFSNGNLKKVVLGKNRYLNYNVPDFGNNIFVEDYFGALFAIKTAVQLLGIEVEIYNDIYGIYGELEYSEVSESVRNMGYRDVPELDYLDPSDWDIKVSTPVILGAQNLLDNDPTTAWAPRFSNGQRRTHEFEIDMKTKQTINGFKITMPQDLYFEAYEQYLPNQISIFYSSDGYVWKNVVLQDYIVLGGSVGETTIVNLKNPIAGVQYVKFKLLDTPNGDSYNSYLGDFMVF